jgi:general stress protein 26
MDKTDIHSFLTRQRYGVVSSISAIGTPQSALMGIATTPELEIIFDTLKTSRKYPNLVARPSCSVVAGWDGEQTVQLEGIAEELRGKDLKHCQQIYFGAWPDCLAHMSLPEITYFVVHPKWIRYSDFDQTPPYVKEITIHA